MFKIGDRLKDLREKKGLSQVQLAKLLEVSNATIANYESERRALTFDKLQEILSALGSSFEEFFLTKQPNIKKEIPIVSKVSAGNGYIAEEAILDYLSLPEELGKNCDFATFVTGDSMIPLLKENDLILVNKTENLSNGNIGIFSLNESVYVKKFNYNPLTKEIKLVSLNKDYPNISVEKNDNFFIIGKVIGSFDYNL